MYIADLIGSKDEILTKAMQHPAMAVKRKPTIETAMKCVVAELEMQTSKAITAKFKPLIEDAVETYTLLNGEYQYLDKTEQDNWSEGMDNAIEEIFSPLTVILSADWLGRYTIDTHMEQENSATRLSDALGKEVFKQLSYGKEPGQVLSNASILRTDVEIYYEQHMQPKSQEEKQAMAEQVASSISDAITNIYNTVGVGFEPMTVCEHLENVVDDDEILAGGSAQHLGLSEGNMNAIQMYALEFGGKETVAHVLDRLQNYNAEPVAAPPAPPVAPSGAPTPPPPPPMPSAPAAPAKVDASPEGFDGSKVLSLMKDHSGVNETEFAVQLGVSRSTYTNWTKGKSAFKPDEGQLETLRDRLVADLNGLYEALCAVDGIPFDKQYD